LQTANQFTHKGIKMINDIQAMEIQPDISNITTGTIKDVKLIHCVGDGNITVAFSGGDEVVALVAGDDRSIPSLAVTVSTGEFTFNR